MACPTRVGAAALMGGEQRATLKYAPAPVDNPLKGLVPYAGDHRDKFPHSMEFNYLPLSDLMIGYNRFDWSRLERLLNAVASRGHQAVFRVYLEYPGKPLGVPQFLIDDGVEIRRYMDESSGQQRPSVLEGPDYENPKLRKALRQFIAALGKRYDGDPRIGFVTAGLLGKWGEWHTHPRPDLFASKAVQTELMDAYEEAFKVIPILLRYPAGEADSAYAANDKRPLGYHDDSFAWATLETGRREDAWFFLARLKAAGPHALHKWKTQPIGGEIRPEAWGKVFDSEPGDPRIQDFSECVEATHVTWLMDTGMFRKEQSPERIARAEAAVRRMGYEFYVSEVIVRSASDGALAVSVQVENRGVAPFYYDWPVEFGLVSPEGKLILCDQADGRLKGLLPGAPPRIWRERLDVAGVTPGRYQLVLRVPNPLPHGKPVRFANSSQDADATDWLTLTEIELSRP